MWLPSIVNSQSSAQIPMELSRNVRSLSLALFVVISITFSTVTFLRYPKPLDKLTSNSNPFKEIGDFDPSYLNSSKDDLFVLNSSSVFSPSCSDKPSLRNLLEPSPSMPAALNDYAKFHRRWRRCLFGEYRCIGKPPAILVYNTEGTVSGGLGDRMLSLRLLFILSLITRRFFLINWQLTAQHPYEITSVLHPSYIDWRCTEEQFITLKERYGPSYFRTRVFTNYEQGVENGIFHPLPNASKSLLYAQKDNFELEFSNYSLIIFHSVVAPHQSYLRYIHNPNAVERTEGLRNMTLLELERTIVNFLLRPSPAIEFLARYRGFAFQKEYIGLHVRTGDDVHEKEDMRFQGMHDKYDIISKRLVVCLKRVDEQKLRRIFLASDSLMFKASFEKEALSQGFDVSTTKRFTWHIDRSIHERFKTSYDNCIAFFDVFADAYALSRARSVIFFPSGFPLVSIALDGARTKNWLEFRWDQELTADDCKNMTSEF